MTDLMIRQIDGGVIFKAKIVPASSKTAISGLLDGMLKIKLSAPPQKGKANQSMIDLLAKQLGVKKNAVSITAGQTKPVKNVQVLGISAEKLLDKLGLKSSVKTND